MILNLWPLSSSMVPGPSCRAAIRLLCLQSAVLTRVRSSDSAIREFVPEIHIDLGSDAMPAVWCVPGAEGVEGATDVTGVTNVAMSDVTGVTDVAEGQRREL